MAKAKQIAGPCAVVLILTAPAHAQLVTVTGGSIAPTAQAGESGYTYQSDTPTPAPPQQPGSVSLTATANGTAYSSGGGAPPGVWPVSATATGTVNVTNDASGGSTVDLQVHATAQPLWQGAGSYCCASSSVTDTVLFTLNAPVEAGLTWSNSFDGGVVAGTLIDETTGTTVFTASQNTTSTTASFLLPAGQYQAYADAATSLQRNAQTELTVTLPSPVPIPSAIWLFGSALLGLFARRRASHSA